MGWGGWRKGEQKQGGEDMRRRKDQRLRKIRRGREKRYVEKKVRAAGTCLVKKKKGHKTTKKMQNEERVMMASYKSGVAGVSIVTAHGSVVIRTSGVDSVHVTTPQNQEAKLQKRNPSVSLGMFITATAFLFKDTISLLSHLNL